MPTIAEHLGINPKGITYEQHPALPATTAFGFEVELENGKWPAIAGWVKKDDGSLRDGKEYIFDGPQSGGTAVASLEAFDEAMKKVKPDPTFRCSTHCHMDVRKLTFDQYERTVLAYMVFEDVFFDHCDRRRRESNFCIPFYKNDWLSAAFGRRVLAAQGDARKFRGCAQWPKYSALNLQVTSSFGSIEFRGSHAMVDKVEMLQLAQRMQHLLRLAYASTAKDHYGFIQELQKMPLKEVFPTGLSKGYAMDEGALDQGISTAMHALLTCELERLGMQAIPAEAPRAGRVQDLADNTARTVLNMPITYNNDALLALNVATPTRRHTLLDAIKMVAALQQLVGVNTVALTGMVPNLPRDHIVWMRRNTEALSRRSGFAITEDMLN